MQKDYTRMNRPLSIIAAIFLLLVCVSIVVNMVDYQNNLSFFRVIYGIYTNVSQGLLVALNALTFIILLRGKKDLPAAIVFIAQAAFQLLIAVVYPFVIIPACEKLGMRFTLDPVLFSAPKLMFMLMWLLPALSVLTKDRFPGEKLSFLTVLFAAGYVLLSLLQTLQNQMAYYQMRYSFALDAGLSLPEMLIRYPEILVELLPIMLADVVGLAPYVLLALALCLPYRTKAPKLQPSYQPVQAQPGYIPLSQQPAPVPEEHRPMYVPADPAPSFPPVQEEKPKLTPYVPPVVQDEDPRAQQLKSLKRLLDQDLITQEDYDAKKKQILGL